VQDVAAALDPKNLLVGKEFECDMDKVYDVMGKYLLENLLCLHPADRMPSKVCPPPINVKIKIPMIVVLSVTWDLDFGIVGRKHKKILVKEFVLS
jgi:hypothetical protein